MDKDEDVSRRTKSSDRIAYHILFSLKCLSDSQGGMSNHHYRPRTTMKICQQHTDGLRKGSCSRCSIWHLQSQNSPTRTVKNNHQMLVHWPDLQLKKEKNRDQKEGNGKIHMGFCALGFRVVRLLYIRNGFILKGKDKKETFQTERSLLTT